MEELGESDPGEGSRKGSTEEGSESDSLELLEEWNHGTWIMDENYEDGCRLQWKGKDLAKEADLLFKEDLERKRTVKEGQISVTNLDFIGEEGKSVVYCDSGNKKDMDDEDNYNEGIIIDDLICVGEYDISDEYEKVPILRDGQALQKDVIHSVCSESVIHGEGRDSSAQEIKKGCIQNQNRSNGNVRTHLNTGNECKNSVICTGVNTGELEKVDHSEQSSENRTDVLRKSTNENPCEQDLSNRVNMQNKDGSQSLQNCVVGDDKPHSEKVCQVPGVQDCGKSVSEVPKALSAETRKEQPIKKPSVRKQIKDLPPSIQAKLKAMQQSLKSINLTRPWITADMREEAKEEMVRLQAIFDGTNSTWIECIKKVSPLVTRMSAAKEEFMRSKKGELYMKQEKKVNKKQGKEPREKSLQKGTRVTRDYENVTRSEVSFHDPVSKEMVSGVLNSDNISEKSPIMKQDADFLARTSSLPPSVNTPTFSIKSVPTLIYIDTSKKPENQPELSSKSLPLNTVQTSITNQSSKGLVRMIFSNLPAEVSSSALGQVLQMCFGDICWEIPDDIHESPSEYGFYTVQPSTAFIMQTIFDQSQLNGAVLKVAPENPKNEPLPSAVIHKSVYQMIIGAMKMKKLDLKLKASLNLRFTYSKDELLNLRFAGFNRDTMTELAELMPIGMELKTFKINQCKGRLSHISKTCPDFHSHMDRRRDPQVHQYKPVACRHVKPLNTWRSSKKCLFKDKCRYAHSKLELLCHPDVIAKTICYCKVSGCQFWHTPEKRFDATLFKTVPCLKGLNKCMNFSTCHFYHHDGDKRRNPKEKDYGPLRCTSLETKCMEGEDCRFCHNEIEQDYHPLNYKKKKCGALPGQCSKGNLCPNLHSDDSSPKDITAPENNVLSSQAKVEVSEAINNKGEVEVISTTKTEVLLIDLTEDTKINEPQPGNTFTAKAASLSYPVTKFTDSVTPNPSTTSTTFKSKTALLKMADTTATSKPAIPLAEVVTTKSAAKTTTAVCKSAVTTAIPAPVTTTTSCKTGATTATPKSVTTVATSESARTTTASTPTVTAAKAKSKQSSTTASLKTIISTGACTLEPPITTTTPKLGTTSNPATPHTTTTCKSAPITTTLKPSNTKPADINAALTTSHFTTVTTTPAPAITTPTPSSSTVTPATAKPTVTTATTIPAITTPTSKPATTTSTLKPTTAPTEPGTSSTIPSPDNSTSNPSSNLTFLKPATITTTPNSNTSNPTTTTENLTTFTSLKQSSTITTTEPTSNADVHKLTVTTATPESATTVKPKPVTNKTTAASASTITTPELPSTTDAHKTTNITAKPESAAITKPKPVTNKTTASASTEPTSTADAHKPTITTSTPESATTIATKPVTSTTTASSITTPEPASTSDAHKPTFITTTPESATTIKPKPVTSKTAALSAPSITTPEPTSTTDAHKTVITVTPESATMIKPTAGTNKTTASASTEPTSTADAHKPTITTATPESVTTITTKPVTITTAASLASSIATTEPFSTTSTPVPSNIIVTSSTKTTTLSTPKPVTTTTAPEPDCIVVPSTTTPNSVATTATLETSTLKSAATPAVSKDYSKWKLGFTSQLSEPVNVISSEPATTVIMPGTPTSTCKVAVASKSPCKLTLASICPPCTAPPLQIASPPSSKVGMTAISTTPKITTTSSLMTSKISAETEMKASTNIPPVSKTVTPSVLKITTCTQASTISTPVHASPVKPIQITSMKTLEAATKTPEITTKFPRIDISNQTRTCISAEPCVVTSVETPMVVTVKTVETPVNQTKSSHTKFDPSSTKTKAEQTNSSLLKKSPSPPKVRTTSQPVSISAFMNSAPISNVHQIPSTCDAPHSAGAFAQKTYEATTCKPTAMTSTPQLNPIPMAGPLVKNVTPKIYTKTVMSKSHVRTLSAQRTLEIPTTTGTVCVSLVSFTKAGSLTKNSSPTTAMNPLDKTKTTLLLPTSIPHSENVLIINLPKTIYTPTTSYLSETPLSVTKCQSDTTSSSTALLPASSHLSAPLSLPAKTPPLPTSPVTIARLTPTITTVVTITSSSSVPTTTPTKSLPTTSTTSKPLPVTIPTMSVTKAQPASNTSNKHLPTTAAITKPLPDNKRLQPTTNATQASTTKPIPTATTSASRPCATTTKPLPTTKTLPSTTQSVPTPALATKSTQITTTTTKSSITSTTTSRSLPRQITSTKFLPTTSTTTATTPPALPAATTTTAKSVPAPAGTTTAKSPPIPTTTATSVPTSTSTTTAKSLPAATTTTTISKLPPTPRTTTSTKPLPRATIGKPVCTATTAKLSTKTTTTTIKPVPTTTTMVSLQTTPTSTKHMPTTATTVPHLSTTTTCTVSLPTSISSVLLPTHTDPQQTSKKHSDSAATVEAPLVTPTTSSALPTPHFKAAVCEQIPSVISEEKEPKKRERNEEVEHERTTDTSQRKEGQPSSTQETDSSLELLDDGFRTPIQQMTFSPRSKKIVIKFHSFSTEAQKEKRDEGVQQEEQLQPSNVTAEESEVEPAKDKTSCDAEKVSSGMREQKTDICKKGKTETLSGSISAVNAKHQSTSISKKSKLKTDETADRGKEQNEPLNKKLRLEEISLPQKMPTSIKRKADEGDGRSTVKKNKLDEGSSDSENISKVESKKPWVVSSLESLHQLKEFLGPYSGQVGIILAHVSQIHEAKHSRSDDSKEKWGPLIQPEVQRVLELALRRLSTMLLSGKIPQRQAPSTRQAIREGHKLLQCVQKDSKELYCIDLDIPALSKALLGKDTLYMKNLIDMVFQYHGKEIKSPDDINNTIIQICSEQLKISSLFQSKSSSKPPFQNSSALDSQNGSFTNSSVKTGVSYEKNVAESSKSRPSSRASVDREPGQPQKASASGTSISKEPEHIQEIPVSIAKPDKKQDQSQKVSAGMASIDKEPEAPQNAPANLQILLSLLPSPGSSPQTTPVKNVSSHESTLSSNSNSKDLQRSSISIRKDLYRAPLAMPSSTAGVPSSRNELKLITESQRKEQSVAVVPLSAVEPKGFSGNVKSRMEPPHGLPQDELETNKRPDSPEIEMVYSTFDRDLKNKPHDITGGTPIERSLTASSVAPEGLQNISTVPTASSQRSTHLSLSSVNVASFSVCSDLPQQEISPPPNPVNVVEEGEDEETLAVEDIVTLLKNFDELSSEEQKCVQQHILKLQSGNPEFLEAVKKATEDD